MTPETERAISLAFDRLKDAVIVMVAALDQERTVSAGKLAPAPDPVEINGKSDLLTVQEVAERLRISESMAYSLTGRGEIPTVRMGKSVRVKSEDLEQYIKAQVS